MMTSAETPRSTISGSKQTLAFAIGSATGLVALAVAVVAIRKRRTEMVTQATMPSQTQTPAPGFL
jgi:hypothetical protein